MMFLMGLMVLSGVLSGCSLKQSDEPQSLLVLSWNLQNLFDHRVQGSEYPEYIPGAEWTSDLYEKRLERTARVIRSAAGDRLDGKSLPDVLLLQEVENRDVLARLNRNYLDNAYPHIFCPRAPGSAVQTAVMSRSPLLEERAHLFTISQGAPQRYILEVALDGGGVLFCNHWKSRLGGEEQTAFYREAAEDLLIKRANRVVPQGWWIAAGDFNQEPEAFSQLPLSGAVNAWDQISRPEQGSYWYNGYPERIDHFFLGSAVVKKGYTLSLPAGEPWADEHGRPREWELWSGEGYSDHLPLLLEVVR